MTTFSGAVFLLTAAAALVEGAISSREDLFDDIRKQASSLSERQDAAMKEAQEAVLGKLK